MELTGSRFAFDIPSDWVAEPRDADGDVVATSKESYAGFTPTIVLKEWRTKHPYPSSLANVAQRNLLELAKQHTILHVEAIPDENAATAIGERRRLWAFSAHEIPGTDDDLVSLLTIQDLLMVEKALAELTVTIPLTTWRRGGSHEAILSSLRPLQYGRISSLLRRDSAVLDEMPETGNNMASDEWATRRDNASRESLSLSGPIPSATPFPDNPFESGFAEEIAELSEKAFKTLDDLALLGYLTKSPRWSSAGRELVRTGLVDRKQKAATPQGERVLRHLRDGKHMALLVDSAPQLLLTFWIHGRSALAVMSFVALGTRALAFCPAKRIPQLLLSLVSFQPSWDMNFSYTLTRNEFLAKLLADIPPRIATSGDAAEFSAQRWVPVSLLGPDEETELAWVMTPNRGVALMETRDDTNEITLANCDPRKPFWELFLETATRLTGG